jgi:serine phosphatase RsbU (regulator of sigma subunit)
VAGDFYDWVLNDDGSLDVTVADVMGKGVGAALVMAVLRTALRSAPPNVRPAQRVAVAATSMAHGMGEDGLFVTLFHARLDTATGGLHYVDAGHGYCAIRRAGGQLVRLSTRSLPVGVSDEEPFREGAAQLDPGDSLVVYSDGLVEREEGTIDLSQFSIELDEAGDAADMVRRLMGRTTLRPADDVTVLVLRRLLAPPAAAPATPGTRRS